MNLAKPLNDHYIQVAITAPSSTFCAKKISSSIFYAHDIQDPAELSVGLVALVAATGCSIELPKTVSFSK